MLISSAPIPTLMPISTNTGTHQYQHWYPSIPTLVPINTHTRAHQYPHSCSLIPTLMPINTNTGTHQYPHSCPSIPILVPALVHINTNTGTHQYPHSYPSVPTLTSINTYTHARAINTYTHAHPSNHQPVYLLPYLPTYPFFYPQTRQIFPFLHQQEDEHEHAIPNCRTSRLTISATRTDRLRDPN